jgi:hypothetical protein
LNPSIRWGVNNGKGTNQMTQEQLFQAIAQKHLFIETLETRRSDSLDFHEVSVWGVEAALKEAFEAGKRAARQRKPKQAA